MSIELIDKIKPKNNGAFALVDAHDVAMPDGTRLDETMEQIGGYPIISDMSSIPVTEGKYVLSPEVYYSFGTVDSLAVICADPDDGKIHEFVFELTPTDKFTKIDFGGTAPVFANDEQYPPGKLCQVSILRGIGVMVSA